MQILPNSFMNLPPESADPSAAQYAVLPVPYDGTVSFMRGTRHGPAAILDASAQVEEFDEELREDFTSAGITTCAPVDPANEPSEQMRRVYHAAREIVQFDKFLLALGGEHSITAPLVQAVAERHARISVLQIDAHADLRDSYGGSKHSHACVMRRVLEITDSICQVGIRNVSKEEYETCQPQMRNLISAASTRADPRWINKVVNMLREKVYVTVDIDGFDPAYAPGTGTPEPGGLSWTQVISLLRRVCTDRQVVGADIVEVAPVSGMRVTEFLAARLAYKIIAYTQVAARARHNLCRAAV